MKRWELKYCEIYRIFNKQTAAIKTFVLNIDVINGVVQEKPQPMFFNCGEIFPQGLTIIRYFDIWMNQYAHQTFYLFYKGNQFGTQQFKTLSDFNNFLLWNCSGTIFALINGCKATINGMTINLN